MNTIFIMMVMNYHRGKDGVNITSGDIKVLVGFIICDIVTVLITYGFIKALG